LQLEDIVPRLWSVRLCAVDLTLSYELTIRLPFTALWKYFTGISSEKSTASMLYVDQICTGNHEAGTLRGRFGSAHRLIADDLFSSMPRSSPCAIAPCIRLLS